MKKYCFPILIAWFLFCSQMMMAQGKEDNVHVVSCFDQYVFKKSADGNTIVVNTSDYTYGVTKYAALVQPNVFYGDFIHLDKAQSKGVAQYKAAIPKNVFFDDSKVCFFSYRIPKVGKTLKASFARTFLDPIYFTTIPLREDYFVDSKTIQVVIPKAFSQFHLRDCNLPADVQKTSSVNAEGDSVFTYVIHDLPTSTPQDNAPAWGYVSPYILVVGSFSDVQDMFAWSKKLADVDVSIPNLNEILSEIKKDAKSELECIANTYAWVQRNIRYLAYEAGISAHQPALPAETIRKRYGDCKAMSLLLKTLLRAQGFDARQTDIGTDDVPYSPQQVPTIAAIDHSICTVYHQGKAYFLDATNPYIPMGYIPANIQGRQALVEKESGCDVVILPVLSEEANSSSEVMEGSLITLDNGTYAMKGNVTSSWSGDMKAMVMSAYESVAKDEKDRLLARILGFGKTTDQLGDIRLEGNLPQAQHLQISAAYTKGDVGLSADGKLYVDMNPDKDIFLDRVDTTKRTCDDMLDMPAKLVRTVKMVIPKDMRVEELPALYESHSEWCDFRRVFRSQGNSVVMEKEYHIKKRRIPLKEIPTWNKLVTDWADACNEQVVLTK